MMDALEHGTPEHSLAMFWLLGCLLDVKRCKSLARHVAQKLGIDLDATLRSKAAIDCPSRLSMRVEFERVALELAVACPEMAQSITAAVKALRAQEADHG
jgi:hypothetical protein